MVLAYALIMVLPSCIYFYAIHGIYRLGHMLLVTNLDYIQVDASHHRVTVGAGATISAILKELSKHKLTLSNFSSIQEQQIAGWTQVAGEIFNEDCNLNKLICCISTWHWMFTFYGG